MTVVFQRDLFTRRWRHASAPTSSEFQIQATLVKILRLKCREGVTFFAVPNGELREKRHAAKLKAMGVKPGVSDLVFIWGELISTPRLQVTPRLLFLELKARGRKLTPEQLDFCNAMHKCGAAFEVADNIDDAIAVLERHGILKR